MSQRTTGLHSVLALPAIYRLFISLVGGARARKVFVHKYLRPKEGERLLDIGCGAGDLLPFLPRVDYVGFDLSPTYVEAARTRFGTRGAFFLGDATALMDVAGLSPVSFDVAVAFGLLHHLDDERVTRLFDGVRILLREGGRFVTFDGCIMERQSRLERFVVSRDRGRAVRTPKALSDLASRCFSHVSVAVRHDLLRIPYAHVILECFR